MKHLYVIGNGFDLHHNMKTSWTHFKNWLIEKDLSVIYTIEDLFADCDDDWWQSFESNLATAVISDIVLEEVRENYPDFSSDNFRDSDWYDAEYAVESTLSEAYNEIRKAFHLWISGLELGDAHKKINLITEDSTFLTFNYTTTLENLYNINKSNILHIHGIAGGDEELILGHGASIKDIEKMLNDGYPTNPEEGDDFITMRAKDAAINGVYSQRKGVEGIIRNNEQWFNSLKDITNIYFYGHSFGDVDIPYFKKILSVVNKTNVMIEVNDYNDENKISINRFMISEGIKPNQYKIISLNDKLLYPPQ